jgi:hypothetical protein
MQHSHKQTCLIYSTCFDYALLTKNTKRIISGASTGPKCPYSGRLEGKEKIDSYREKNDLKIA